MALHRIPGRLTKLYGLFVGDAGAGGAAGLVPAPGAGDAAAGKFLRADRTWAAPSGGSGGSPSPPQLRLTLQSTVPVMTTTQSGKTTVYYSPYRGQYCPLYNGSSFTATDLGGELSQATTDTTKSPAAVVAEACYDVFVWDDSGTKRATRGPAWSYASTITVTIATPAVVSWTAHGLPEGAPVVFTTSGALPTGITAGTVYYVGRSPAANTFNISTTVANAAAGTFVATSGSQSGTHTCTNRTTSRGTGAGTTALTLVSGVYLNANAITNGPAASRGTYVGTIRSNGSSQIDWILGGSAQAAFLNVWNCYNQVMVSTTARESSSSWTYASSTLRSVNATQNTRVSWVQGLNADHMDFLHVCDTDLKDAYTVVSCVPTHTLAYGSISIGLDNTTAIAANATVSTGNLAIASVNMAGAATLTWGVCRSATLFVPGTLGAHYAQAIERSDSSTTTFYGNGRNGLRAIGNF